MRVDIQVLLICFPSPLFCPLQKPPHASLRETRRFVQPHSGNPNGMRCNLTTRRDVLFRCRFYIDPAGMRINEARAARPSSDLEGPATTKRRRDSKHRENNAHWHGSFRHRPGIQETARVAGAPKDQSRLVRTPNDAQNEPVQYV